MNERNDLLNSISETIKDYRKGDIASPTSEHVDRWVDQFSARVQTPLLRELDHVLKRTYFPLERVTSFLQELIETRQLVGEDPCAFWRDVNFLNIQQGGNSQSEMLALFGELLQQKCGVKINWYTPESQIYVYLDDAIFTGNRVRQDLEKWISNLAPRAGKLEIVSIALHRGGHYYASGRLTRAANAAGKAIDTTWWRAIMLEDRKAYTDVSDVFRPTRLPVDTRVQTYVDAMRFKPTFRNPGNIGTNSLFSSEGGRHLLEQEFLKAGVRIREMCPNLGDTQRPLGHSTLETLGFGSLIATFRNCPNNAPLAWWAGEPWYPLFPRTTNSQTKIKRLFEELTKA